MSFGLSRSPCIGSLRGLFRILPTGYRSRRMTNSGKTVSPDPDARAKFRARSIPPTVRCSRSICAANLLEVSSSARRAGQRRGAASNPAPARPFGL